MTNNCGHTKLTILEFPKFMDVLDNRWVEKIRTVFEKGITSIDIESNMDINFILENQGTPEVFDKYSASLKLEFGDTSYEDIENFIDSWGLAHALLPCFNELNVLYRDPKLGKEDDSSYMKVLYTLHNSDGDIEFAAMITDIIPVFSNEEDDDSDGSESNDITSENQFTFTCKVDQRDEVKEQAKELLKK